VNNNFGLGGTVGVGIVSSVGSNVTHLRASDMVLVATPCWADEVTIPVNRVVKLPNLSIEEVSSIPFFLYGEGILRSLPGLKKGDTIFQLSGAGVINDAVVQLAKVRGIQVVSVSESDLLEIKKLKALGNAHHAIAGVANKKVVHQLTKTLLWNGAVVIHHGVYQPISSMTSIDLPVSATIFKNISIRGFDLASWMKYDMASLTSVTASIVELVQTKKISLSTTHQHEMLDYKKAFEDAKNNTAALSVLRLS
jgi:NADPH:quinone reductase-like Zn-dependent oxidoreductase